MTKHDKQKEEQEEKIEIEQSEEIADNSKEIDGRLEEAEAKYKRALADYQNLEKRMAEDRRHWILQANRELLVRVLPILDTLTMAAMHSDDKSLEVSISQFLDILKSEGVTRIEAKGKDFDASVMEAVGTAEGKEGKVIEEARMGFLLHDKLLRPAQVIVGATSV
jgi:molecular chaperone GrpE